MLKTLRVAAILSLLLLLPILAFGQGHELMIPAPTTGDDFLNDHILGDTTATGDRVDLDRIYVLERDGVYFVNTRMVNEGWTIHIKAEDGTGERPVIYLITNTETGGFPSEMFRIRGSLWLKDLIIVGFLEPNNEIGNIPGGLIRTDAAGFDIVIDGCLLTQTRGQIVRTQLATRVVKVTNSIFANMGDLGLSNFGAGKGVDFRDTSCDTALFINNTFVNFQDRVIRHRSSTASINHLIFDHNTLVNGMSYHGTLALGWVGDDVKITNNLFIDTFIAGQDTDAVRQSEFDESGEMDDYGFGKMTWIFSVPNDSTNWEVAGNYYSVSAAVQSFYDSISDDAFRDEGSPLTNHINMMLGDDSTDAFVKEPIEVTDRPDPMIDMATWYRDPNGANKTKSTTNFNRATDDYDRRTWKYFADTLDCTYPNTAAAYTGAQGDFPAGDLNWYPSQKSAWEDYITPVITNKNDAIPSEFSLHQNYPNPFNPTTVISFSLKNAGRTTLTIHNILGQKVATLLDKQMAVGNYHIEFDASHFPSGVYLYELSTDKNVSVRKMLLLK